VAYELLPRLKAMGWGQATAPQGAGREGGVCGLRDWEGGRYRSQGLYRCPRPMPLRPQRCCRVTAGSHTWADWLVSPVPSKSRTSRVRLEATATASIPATWSPAGEAKSGLSAVPAVPHGPGAVTETSSVYFCHKTTSESQLSYLADGGGGAVN